MRSWMHMTQPNLAWVSIYWNLSQSIQHRPRILFEDCNIPTCIDASDPLSISSMTRPSWTKELEGGRPQKSPMTWTTYGLLPSYIIWTSRSTASLPLPVCFRELLCHCSKKKDSPDLPVIVPKQFNSHITAPMFMPDFVDLPKPASANHLPVRQDGPIDPLMRWKTGKIHHSLEEMQ